MKMLDCSLICGDERWEKEQSGSIPHLFKQSSEPGETSGWSSCRTHQIFLSTQTNPPYPTSGYQPTWQQFYLHCWNSHWKRPANMSLGHTNIIRYGNGLWVKNTHFSGVHLPGLPNIFHQAITKAEWSWTGEERKGQWDTSLSRWPQMKLSSQLDASQVLFRLIHICSSTNLSISWNCIIQLTKSCSEARKNNQCKTNTTKYTDILVPKHQ